MPDLSEGEKQILILLRRLELYPPDPQTGETMIATQEALQESGKQFFEKNLEDWTDLFNKLLAQGYISHKKAVYALTERGRPRASQLQWGHYIARAARSKAYSLFCERVYGTNLCQVNAGVEMAQLEQLLEILNLSAESQVIDLGCGIGTITEYVSDKTDADILGIDIVPELIEIAQERTRKKKDRLEFQEGDINHLILPSGSADTIFSIDTLPFADDIYQTIRQMKKVLRPCGQMGLFHFQIATPKDPPDALQPEKTKLAQALKKQDLTFQVWDYTESSEDLWRQRQQVVTDLKEEFQAEGNLDIYKGRIKECDTWLKLLKAGRVGRYLYHANLP
ncbi:MAG: class I SAM-dependent methyltransferase [Candidatus Hodarchaeota archaeon]